MSVFRAIMKQGCIKGIEGIDELINGKVAILDKCRWGEDDRDYVLYGFEDAEVERELFWLVERENGIYSTKEEFLEDYLKDKYEPEGVIVVEEGYFDRIE